MVEIQWPELLKGSQQEAYSLLGYTGQDEIDYQSFLKKRELEATRTQLLASLEERGFPKNASILQVLNQLNSAFARKELLKSDRPVTIADLVRMNRTHLYGRKTPNGALRNCEIGYGSRAELSPDHPHSHYKKFRGVAPNYLKEVVDQLLEKLSGDFSGLDLELTKELASFTALYFVAIQPFHDANSRGSRCLTPKLFIQWGKEPHFIQEDAEGGTPLPDHPIKNLALNWVSDGLLHNPVGAAAYEALPNMARAVEVLKHKINWVFDDPSRMRETPELLGWNRFCSQHIHSELRVPFNFGS